MRIEAKRPLEGAGEGVEPARETAAGRRPRQPLATRLAGLSHYAPKGKKALNLKMLLNAENFRAWFKELRKDAAPGEDRVTVEEYGRNLEWNVAALETRIRNRSYRPQAARRAYIPKGSGGLRPLGMPAVEDKLVQKGIAAILEAIYEPLFCHSTHGFRPGRSCHTALEALDRSIMTKPTNHVIDADIKDFFGTVGHEWLVKFLGETIGDRKFIWLIQSFLKAGYMEHGQWNATESGTPQGGVISPVLSNIYLHKVLDEWVEQAVKPRCAGHVEVIRYADDFVVCVQSKAEAEKIHAALVRRMKQYGLELSVEKTRIIPFGRYAEENARRRGKKPATFDFLGFTHYNSRTRNGAYKLGRRTMAKRFRAKLKALKEWIKRVRYWEPRQEWWPKFCAKILGHQRYYGVSGNYARVRAYTNLATWMVTKWVSRMSQKRLAALKKFRRFLQWHPVPKPRIHVNLYAFRGSSA